MVAESIVTFGPIDQLGWRSACSGVAALICSRVQVRNGPPEAVRMIALDVLARGRRRAPERSRCARNRPAARSRRPLAARAHEQAAGADQAFLVGERDGRAALDRGQRRLQSGRAA